MTTRVLVASTSGTAAGSLMAALQAEGVTLLACDVDPEAPGLSRVPNELRFVVHPTGNPEFIGDLLALCVRFEVDVLIPMGQRELVAIACAREVFERLGTRVLLSFASGAQSGASERRAVAACRQARGSVGARLRRRLNGLFGVGAAGMH